MDEIILKFLFRMIFILVQKIMNYAPELWDWI